MSSFSFFKTLSESLRNFKNNFFKQPFILFASLVSILIILLIFSSILIYSFNSLEVYESFLLNEVKPSLEAGTELSYDQEETLISFGDLLFSLIVKFILVFLICLILISAIRSLRDYMFIKSNFKTQVKLSLKKVLISTLFHSLLFIILFSIYSFILFNFQYITLTLLTLFFIILFVVLELFFSSTFFTSLYIFSDSKITALKRFGLFLISNILFDVVIILVLLVLYSFLSYVSYVVASILVVILLFCSFSIKRNFLISYYLQNSTKFSNKRSKKLKATIHNKKGQVTIFIIVGVVLVIIAGLALILLNNDNSISEDAFTSIPPVRDEYKPIQSFTEKCISEISFQGLDLLGLHGGYIDPLDSDTVGFQMKEDMENPYSSDGVYLTESMDTFIPYWYYNSGNSNDDIIVSDSLAPSLDQSALYLSKYVDDNIIECLNDYSEFLERGIEVTIESQPSSEVLFTDTETLIKTKIKLSVERTDGSVEEINEFLTRVDVPYKKYYSMAVTILSREVEHSFFENFVKYLISYYGRADANSIPPFYAADNNEVAIIWPKQIVEMRFKDLLSSYIPLFRVPQTKGYVEPDLSSFSEEEAGFYNLFKMPLFNEDYSEVDVGFLYLYWPIYLDVYPNRGDLIVPRTDYFPGKNIVTAQKDNAYKFYYDVSFPLVVQLHEDNVGQGRGFTFLFAMEPSIINNLHENDYKNGLGPIPWDTNLVSAELPSIPNNAVDQDGNSIPQPQVNHQLFQNPSTWISGNISYRIYDGLTRNSLNDVVIEIGVSDYATTLLGTTRWYPEFQDSRFLGPAPIVNNGYLKFKKEGYDEKILPITTREFEDQPARDIYLWPIETKNVSVRVYQLIPPVTNSFDIGDLYMNPTTLFISNYLPQDVSYTVDDDGNIMREILPNEELFISLKKQGEFGQDTTAFIHINNLTNMSNLNIDLIPGLYEISGTIIDHNGVVVPKRCKKICSGVSCLSISPSRRRIPFNDVEIKPALWGGIEFNETRPTRLTTNTVYNDESLVITLIKFGPPTCLDSLEQTNNLAQITQRNMDKVSLFTTSEDNIINVER